MKSHEISKFYLTEIVHWPNLHARTSQVCQWNGRCLMHWLMNDWSKKPLACPEWPKPLVWLTVPSAACCRAQTCQKWAVAGTGVGRAEENSASSGAYQQISADLWHHNHQRHPSQSAGEFEHQKTEPKRTVIPFVVASLNLAQYESKTYVSWWMKRTSPFRGCCYCGNR